MKSLLTILAATAMALAADNSITGTWDVQTEVMGNGGSAVCTLKQDGNKVTGTCSSGGADRVVTGEITEKKVVWKHAAEYNGEALTITYSGTVESATSMAGDVNVLPFDVNGTFKARKKE